MTLNRKSDDEDSVAQETAKEEDFFLAKPMPDDRKEDTEDTIFGWVVTLASLVNQCIIYGVILSFGVLFVELLDYYSRKRGETAWIGSIVHGLFCFAAPVSEVMVKKYGYRLTTITGALMTASGLIVSSFVSRMEYLYFTYGFVCGCGLGLIFLPSMVILFQYMRKRRSLAIGLSSTGLGLGATVFSILCRSLLNEYGIKGTFLIFGGITLNAVSAGALFRPVRQQPSSDSQSESVPVDRKVGYCTRFRKYFIFTNMGFYIIMTVDFLSCLMGFVPFAHLPKLSRDYNMSESEVTSLVPLMSAANIVGRLFFGWIGDFKSVSVGKLWSMALVICGISLLMCPLLKTFPLLGCFAVIYGIFVGVWGGLKPLVLAEIVGEKDVGKSYGLLLFLNGFAIISGSPLVGWLHDLTGSYSVPLYSGGAILVFSGFIALCHRAITKLCNYCRGHGKQ